MTRINTYCIVSICVFLNFLFIKKREKKRKQTKKERMCNVNERYNR